MALSAHYPAVDYNQPGERRILEGGQEYLFGTTEVNQGSSSAALRMKRMTVPVVLLSENGGPYEGDAKVTLHLQNEGIQNLRTGLIQPTRTLCSKKLKSIKSLTVPQPTLFRKGLSEANASEPYLMVE